ncbi:MAG: NADH-quinone oxidoreductase subunit NuoF [Firmicutes bacterium]|nr:NADH-quinone oxidoreductase subunit NuoF [Bacillota bacterium]
MVRIKSLEQLINIREALRKEDESRNPVRILVGMATCGIAAGAGATYEAFQKEIQEKGIGNAVLVKAGCLGSCYAEPTVVIAAGGREPVFYGDVTADRVSGIIEQHIQRGETVKELEAAGPAGIRIALRNCGLIDPESIEDYIRNDGYLGLGRVLTSMAPAEVIDLVKKSGLRGRGGGGFPTGLKWETASKYPSDQKYIVCNADEGDPGAFMDRSILEGDPHSVLEAMAIAGYTVGADKGYIYIRAEYPLAIKRLKTALAQAKERGLLGKDILNRGFDFDIELRYGAGAFVCGEETSLIKSIEGERGEPANKPPYPAEKGLWQKPTTVNNVETFASIPPIINRGAEWFSAIGTEKSKGTKVFALAGKVKKVGLTEVPMGTTLRDIIFGTGGGIKNDRRFKAVQTGGPSGGCIPSKYLDTPIDYETLTGIGSMMGSGGMIVMDESDCMVNLAKFYLEFSMDESCGKCTPCRIGNKRLHEILTKITSGQGTMQDLENLKELGAVIKNTALCGLGQTSPNPVLSSLNHFYDEFIAHVVEKRCPAGVCPSLVRYEVNNEKCKGCTACVKACPVKCISGEIKQPHRIDQEKCIRCGACYRACKKLKAIEKR